MLFSIVPLCSYTHDVPGFGRGRSALDQLSRHARRMFPDVPRPPIPPLQFIQNHARHPMIEFCSHHHVPGRRGGPWILVHTTTGGVIYMPNNTNRHGQVGVEAGGFRQGPPEGDIG